MFAQEFTTKKGVQMFDFGAFIFFVLVFFAPPITLVLGYLFIQYDKQSKIAKITFVVGIILTIGWLINIIVEIVTRIINY